MCLYQAFLSQVLSEPHSYGPGFLYDRKQYAGPAIVSLNYDMVVEKKLETITPNPTGQTKQCYYGYGVSRESPDWDENQHCLPLIKLHGSVNWQRQCQCCVQTIGNWECKTAVNDPMIFPSWQRISLAGTVFAKLLDEARIHLRLASRIVFIGYSLPPTDRYIRYLLADVLDTIELPEIEIANRWDDETALRHVTDMMGSRIANKLSRNYSDGLIGLVKSKRDPSSIGNSA